MDRDGRKKWAGGLAGKIFISLEGFRDKQKKLVGVSEEIFPLIN